MTPPRGYYPLTESESDAHTWRKPHCATGRRAFGVLRAVRRARRRRRRQRPRWPGLPARRGGGRRRGTGRRCPADLTGSAGNRRLRSATGAHDPGLGRRRRGHAGSAWRRAFFRDGLVDGRPVRGRARLGAARAGEAGGHHRRGATADRARCVRPTARLRPGVHPAVATGAVAGEAVLRRDGPGRPNGTRALRSARRRPTGRRRRRRAARRGLRRVRPDVRRGATPPGWRRRGLPGLDATVGLHPGTDRHPRRRLGRPAGRAGEDCLAARAGPSHSRCDSSRAARWALPGPPVLPGHLRQLGASSC